MNEQCCANCKFSIISSGDYVPYGSTMIPLPDTIECDNPDIPEEKFDEYFENDGESCEYFEAKNN